MKKYIKTVFFVILSLSILLSTTSCSIVPDRIKNQQQNEIVKGETVTEETTFQLPSSFATYASHYMGKVTDITNDYFIADEFLYYFKPSGAIEEVRKVNGDKIVYAGNTNRVSTGLKEHIFIIQDENGRQFIYNNRKTENLDCSGLDLTNLMNADYKNNEFTLTYSDGSKETYQYNIDETENIETLNMIEQTPASFTESFLQQSLRLNKYEFKIKNENTLLHQSFTDTKEREFVLPDGVKVEDIKIMAYSQEANYRVFIQTEDAVYYYNNRNKDYTFKLHKELTEVYKENPDMKLFTITLMNANTKTFDSIMVLVNNTIYMYNDPEHILK